MKPHLPFTLACSFQDAPWHDFGETGKEAVPGQVRGVVVGRLCLACGAHCVFSLVEQYLVGSCWERGLLSRRLRSRLSGPLLEALNVLRGGRSRAKLGGPTCRQAEVFRRGDAGVYMCVCVHTCVCLHM